MNVLMLSQSYPKCRGDLTAPFVESIATSIAARGLGVHMVLPEHREWRRAASEDGVCFHIYRYAPSPGWMIWGYSSSLWGDVRIKRKNYVLAPIVALSTLRLLNALTARERFDLIHAHWVLPNAPLAALVAARRRLPLVISLHGSDLFLAEKNGAWGRAARWCFEQARAVTAPSEDMLARAERLGLRAERAVLIPYGADVQTFTVPEHSGAGIRAQLGLKPDELMVLAIGRLVYKKGFRYLIEALASTASRTHLVFVGDGDLRAELESQAQSLGLGPRVHFAGAVAHERVPAYLAAADIVAIPSIRDAAGNVDGLPNVALEALAAGKPVVASRVAGLPQVVAEGVNGLLVPEQDAAALAGAIERLGADAALRSRMGAAGRRRIVEELNWDSVACKFIETYAHALRQHALA